MCIKPGGGALQACALLLSIMNIHAAHAAPLRICPGPTVQQVVKATLTRLDRHSTTLRSARRRLRWAALLPKLSGRVTRSSGSAAYMDVYPTTRLDQNLHLGTRWEVRASWDLTRLLFDERELRIASQATKLARRRRALGQQVVQLYFERCRLLVIKRGGGPSEMTAGDGLAGRLQTQMKLRRVTALLNVMTDGLLYHHVPAPGSKQRGALRPGALRTAGCTKP